MALGAKASFLPVHNLSIISHKSLECKHVQVMQSVPNDNYRSTNSINVCMYVCIVFFLKVQVYLVTAEFILPIARLSCSLQLSWAGAKSLSAGGGHIQVIAVL